MTTPAFFLIKVESQDLIDKKKKEHIQVTYSLDGLLRAISWLYETKDGGLQGMAKRRSAMWNRDAGGWVFADPSSAQAFLAEIIKRNPDWPIIGQPDKPFMPLIGERISRISLRNGLHACLIPALMPHFSRLPNFTNAFRLSGGNKGEIGLLIGCSDEISAAVDSLVEQGANCDDSLARKWPLDASKKLRIKASGWAISVQCDLFDPRHYLIAPPQKFKWDGLYPFGTRVAVPWDGRINITRKTWPQLRKRIEAAGLDWDGDDPEAELTVPVAFDESLVHGWNSPAPNGYLLHAYQKEGARFCASRSMRALIGDEMGVGKTVQAIAAVEATAAERVIIICPANARYVWDREIKGWSGHGAIQHIENQLDKLDVAAKWHILTYDLIAARAETWRLHNEAEAEAFKAAFPNLSNLKEVVSGEYPRKVSLDKPLDEVPAFSDPKRVDAWQKMMQRLRGELLEQILAAGCSTVILDEAHRVKNRNTKRTKAIERIAASDAQLLMLTGTPLRNNEHEAAVLLSLLDADAAQTLSTKNGYTIQDIQDCLGYFMIRRTKSEVLPELPDKTRQRIDISALDQVSMQQYQIALECARESYLLAIQRGKSEAEARQTMQGGIEKARTALGVAKVLGGEVSDLVLDVVENKECCVVFCAHHDASDKLREQLEKDKIRVRIIDGRVPQKERAEIVAAFQSGALDVVIGGINAAGEAITLTRADTVIFVELDWVPAALLQAEDRIHRVGQKSNCQVIQLIARISNEENLDEIMADLIGRKLARIGMVLNEDGSNIIAGSIQSEVHSRLLGVMHKPASRPQTADEPLNDGADDQAETVVAEPIKRKRGRPRMYTDTSPPTATERAQRSTKALAAAGGKRVMLRLTPEAHEALQAIMELTGGTQETAAINQALIDRKNELLSAST